MADQRPNIVFILADDLGYTDLGCYGSGYYETPNIDRLAAEGMRCTDGYTCGPNCQPTRAALLSGQYGPRTGVYTVGSIDRFKWQSRPLRPVDNVISLPLGIETFAAAVKRSGYVTGMFGKWHLGKDEQYHPARRGFDEAIVSGGKHFKFRTNPKVNVPDDAYLADFLTQRAVDFIERHREEPFLLYLPHFAVHTPIQAKQELIDKFGDKPRVGGHHHPKYAAMIASLDESVGRVVDTLEKLDLSRRTLVIFSSDNGGVGGYAREGIRGRRNAGEITDNAPLRGGKGMLYEGGIRVPFIFRWPGVISPGSTCDEPIISVDVYPTLLDLTGAEPAPGQPLDGVGLVPLIESSGTAELERDAIYWHFPGYLGAGKNGWRTLPLSVIRQGDWKLMEFLEDGRLELYNLNRDISEQHDLADEEPQLTRNLHAQLCLWREQIMAPMPTENTNQ